MLRQHNFGTFIAAAAGKAVEHLPYLQKSEISTLGLKNADPVATEGQN